MLIGSDIVNQFLLYSSFGSNGMEWVWCGVAESSSGGGNSIH